MMVKGLLLGADANAGGALGGRVQRARDVGGSGGKPTPARRVWGVTANAAASWGGQARGGADGLWGNQMAYRVGSYEMCGSGDLSRESWTGLAAESMRAEASEPDGTQPSPEWATSTQHLPLENCP